jgi:nicotinamidase-related amidase
MKKTLLLVMDMINDLVAEDGFGAKTYGVQIGERNVLANVAAAIAAARRAKVAVGYVRIGFSADYRECPPASPIFTGARKNGVFQLGSRGTQVHPAIAPEPQDFDIVKHRVSPFHATALEAILSANRIERIVMCGVSTNGVVQSGVRDAHDRDFEAVVLEDCCAGASPEEHRHAIACLDRFATILPQDRFDFTG